ncbi:hypothetical protein L6452_14351 [Arctium lappa]|uniref:Uncharacterized protein n=1 Tax=Arctium lappa TaxID=4217 RepID=A0ACB9CKT3_ARCLA|nr:hypothetical protein L6452_14351 [Arctium lappa]
MAAPPSRSGKKIHSGSLFFLDALCICDIRLSNFALILVPPVPLQNHRKRSSSSAGNRTGRDHRDSDGGGGGFKIQNSTTNNTSETTY